MVGRIAASTPLTRARLRAAARPPLGLCYNSITAVAHIVLDSCAGRDGGREALEAAAIASLQLDHQITVVGDEADITTALAKIAPSRPPPVARSAARNFKFRAAAALRMKKPRGGFLSRRPLQKIWALQARNSLGGRRVTGYPG